MCSALQNRTLYVEEAPGTNEEVRSEVAKIARSWQLYSAEKMAEVDDQHMKSVYDAAEKVNRVTYQRADLRATNYRKTFTAFLCHDDALELKGFALTSEIELPKRQKKFIHLNYLSTDPKNLFILNRIKGIGPSLVTFLKSKSVREGYGGIFVEPLPQVRAFFEAMGFLEIDDTGSKKNPMIWIP
ncbi:MAG: hypothetical protein JSS32_03760 [Verrucomicrobia bacterium]|nr:hypothetical protein [Verrucomicrobiota bacterium]